MNFSGAMYDGYWRKNKKHGNGYFISKNDLKFDCNFVDDKIQSTSGSSIIFKIVSGE